ncbi:MAG: prepilin-type N-terminal cleavage/methylation domain-containing protein [Verrucomicrobiota bacterium JB024]|nr:prepilin-type N-terminal cleavage/methylation domain-containing protein [Verrucomicrobiota bacterium JB024]
MSQKTSGGFSLMELLVCIAVIGVLVALSFPAIRQMRMMSASAQCSSNLRQIGVATGLYVAEHNGNFPPLPENASNNWYSYTIWNNPGGKRQWMYMGKLFEGGYIEDGRAFYCPTAKEGTFDYESQWAQRVEGTTVNEHFRIGYLQRVTDNQPTPGVLTPSDHAHPRILMTDNFLARDNSLHPYADKSTQGQRELHVLFSDGHVGVDASGNRWYHRATGSLYDDWEQNF